jgi:hypothetical protein
MLGRILVLMGGLSGAAGLSQFPEFSQQYLQRLAGQVDALAAVEAAFDASAARSGLDREGALAAFGDVGFSARHAADLRAIFRRAERLRADLALLREAGIYERLLLPHRMSDPQLLRDTWADFAPALPLTAAGAICAGLGFLGGWLTLGGILALIRWPARRMLGA